MLFFKKIKQFYFSKILRRKYFREGSCAKCGACCKHIYVRHANVVIKTQDEFEQIKKEDDYPFWHYLEIISSDELGLVFKCNMFDTEKSLCKIHKKRPSICKNYPSEDIFSMGAILKKDCGYKFKPIYSFDEVLDKLSKKTKQE